MADHSSMVDHGHMASLLDTDLDIADAFEIVVTTPASGSYWMAHDVACVTVCSVTVTDGVAIGVAGTALSLRGKSRQGDHPDVYAVSAEYGGTYTGGTVILSRAERSGEAGADPILMKPSTSYLITVTSKADNNYASCVVHVWKEG